MCAVGYGPRRWPRLPGVVQQFADEFCSASIPRRANLFCVRKVSVIAVAVVACTASLLSAAPAQAASLWDSTNQCIGPPPAGWTTVPSVPGDGFVMNAPSSLLAGATALAAEIRSKNMVGLYKSRLGIAHLGVPTQGPDFPIYYDPELLRENSTYLGVKASVCGSTYDGLIVDSSSTIEQARQTAAHELMHAAQSFLAPGFDDNWWYEATAEWAVHSKATFSYGGGGGYASAVTAHPSEPIDQWDGVTGIHQYGAFAFVQWLYQRGSISWSDLATTFRKAGQTAATPVVRAAVGADEFDEAVASFWGDHLNVHPSVGPSSPRQTIKVPVGTSSRQVAPQVKYASRLVSLTPPASAGLLQVHISNVPVGVRVHVREAEGRVVELKPGQTYTESFCRSGAKPGTLRLPPAGDVRVSVTAISGSVSGKVTVETTASTVVCPNQLVVTPGVGVGHLLLGMTRSQAAAAARETGYKKFQNFAVASYRERAGATPVQAWFKNGRIIWIFLGLSYGDYRMKNGSQFTYYLPGSVNGAMWPPPVLGSKKPASAKCADFDPGSGELHPELECNQKVATGRYTSYLYMWQSGCFQGKNPYCGERPSVADCDKRVNPPSPLAPCTPLDIIDPGYYLFQVVVSTVSGAKVHLF